MWGRKSHLGKIARGLSYITYMGEKANKPDFGAEDVFMLNAMLNEKERSDRQVTHQEERIVLAEEEDVAPSANRKPWNGLANGNTIKKGYKYQGRDGKLLFAYAASEHFELPIEIPQESATRKYELVDMLRDIAKKDMQLSYDVWSWCIEEFGPLMYFERDADRYMTDEVLRQLDSFPEGYRKGLIYYWKDHPKFCKKVLAYMHCAPEGMHCLVKIAMDESLYDMAKKIFKICCKKTRWYPDRMIVFVESLLRDCMNDKKNESIAYFEKELYPIVRSKARKEAREKAVSTWPEQIQAYKNYKAKQRREA